MYSLCKGLKRPRPPNFKNIGNAFLWLIQGARSSRHKWAPCLSLFTRCLLNKHISMTVNLEGQHGFSDAGRERCLCDVTCHKALLHPWKLMTLSSVHPHLPPFTQTFVYLLKYWQHQMAARLAIKHHRGEVKVIFMSKEDQLGGREGMGKHTRVRRARRPLCMYVWQTAPSRRNMMWVHTKPPELCLQSSRVSPVHDSRRHIWGAELKSVWAFHVWPTSDLGRLDQTWKRRHVWKPYVLGERQDVGALPVFICLLTLQCEGRPQQICSSMKHVNGAGPDQRCSSLDCFCVGAVHLCVCTHRSSLSCYDMCPSRPPLGITR